MGKGTHLPGNQKDLTGKGNQQDTNSKKPHGIWLRLAIHAKWLPYKARVATIRKRIKLLNISQLMSAHLRGIPFGRWTLTDNTCASEDDLKQNHIHNSGRRLNGITTETIFGHEWAMLTSDTMEPNISYGSYNSNQSHHDIGDIYFNFML